MHQPTSRDAGGGIAYVLLGIVLLPIMITIAKSRAAEYPLTQAAWARLTQASFVSPIGYAELIVAAAFGHAIFGNMPDRYT